MKFAAKPKVIIHDEILYKAIQHLVESAGYKLVYIPINDSCVHEECLYSAEIIITSPFVPTCLSNALFDKLPNLKLCVTSGIGFDSIDLSVANERQIAVTKVSQSNILAMAEHAIMTMLVLIRNYCLAHQQAINGEWDIAKCAKNEYDLDGKSVAIVGADMLAFKIFEKLIAFNPKSLFYYDAQGFPTSAVDKLNKASLLLNGKPLMLEKCNNIFDLITNADVVVINGAVDIDSWGLFNKQLISHMKKGAYIINTSTGAIINRQAVSDAVISGDLGGFSGAAWDVQTQPIPLKPNNYAQSISLHARQRYADGVKEILTSYFLINFKFMIQAAATKMSKFDETFAAAAKHN